MRTINYNLIGTRIKFKRKSANYTQKQLAQYLDVSIGYISQIERGITKINLDTLAKIANFLQCDIAELITMSNSTNYDNSLIEFYEIYKKLSLNEQNLIIKLVNTYLENQA